MKNTSYVETITPDMAEAWIQRPYRHQRKISKKWVEHLADEMRRGRFEPTALIHFAVNQDGTMDLVNGNHTLRAVVQSQKTIVATVLQSNEATDKEVFGLYASHDGHRRRNFGDIALMYDLPKRMGLPISTILRIASAVKFARRNFGSWSFAQMKYISHEEMADIVPRWQSEAKAISASVQGSVADRYIRLIPIYTIALLTYHYQPDNAREFWPAAMTCEGVEKGDPRYTLHQYLANMPTVIGNQKTDRRVGERDSHAIIVRKALNAWNAYVKADSLSLLRVGRDSVYKPVSIEGTPYNGQQSPDFWPTRNLG